LANIWSVCRIKPLANLAVAASDPGNVPDYGEFDSGVVYPNSGSPYHSWVEVPGMALAHIMFNDVEESVDPVGYLRNNGELHEVSIADIYDKRYPPFELTYPIDGVNTTIYVTELYENYDEKETSFIGFTRNG
jgi:hypothetical protein